MRSAVNISLFFILIIFSGPALAANCGVGSSAEDEIRMEWSNVVGARIVKWHYYSYAAWAFPDNKAENREKTNLLAAQLTTDCSKIAELGCPGASTINSDQIPFKTLAEFCSLTATKLRREASSVKLVAPAKSN
jgi:hypothetical protein